MKAWLFLSRLIYRAATRVNVTAMGTGPSHCVALAMLAFDFRLTIGASDVFVGHWVKVVNARTVWHLPIPTVRTALCLKLNHLTSATRHRHFPWNEASPRAQIFSVRAWERISHVAITASCAQRTR